MLDFKRLIEGLHLDRDQIFISVSSEDKSDVIRFVREIEGLRLKYWCMYDGNGRERNISGDNYAETINKELCRCCVFILLLSKHSISSDWILREVKFLLDDTAKKGKNGPVVKLLPIIIDDTRIDDADHNPRLKNLLELTGVGKDKTIIRYYDSKLPREDTKFVFEEIQEKYYNAVFENIQRKVNLERDSQKFNELMSSCVRNKCSASSISDDIKESTEISADSLKEMHVLSNEMLEYDCNTYSCMVIASNLLGTEQVTQGVKTYDPEKEGVKYYYYTPQSNDIECNAAFEKVKEFVRKTKNSRREVTSLIRREFCVRNKVDTFFRNFNDMTMEHFMEQYHVEEPEDVAAFNKLFFSELAQSYFAYSDEADVFSVPDEFLAWICGDDERYSYNTMIEVSYEFIDFLGAFVNFLGNAKDVNGVSYKLLKTHYAYLEKFKKLEDWQIGGRHDMTVSDSKRLVNYLLDYTANAGNKRVKKFPRLANWMQFNFDGAGNICEIDEDVIQAAFRNLIRVNIHEDERLRLCYSFALFVGRTETSGAWYTTGSGMMNDREENTVTTYNITRQSSEFPALLDAYSYMISINPEAKSLLRETKSELLRFLKEHESRGNHK